MRHETLKAALAQTTKLKALIAQKLALMDQMERALWQELHMDSTNTVAWDRKMLGRFKRVYTQVVNHPEKLDAFTFEGHEYVVDYAKYLIEYLEGQLHAN